MKPIRQRLYAGNTTLFVGHTEIWFDGKEHTKDPARMPPYRSDNPGQIKAQTTALKAAGLDALMPNWYGPDNKFIDAALKNYLANLSGLRFILNIDNGAFGSLAELQAVFAYARQNYLSNPNYVTWRSRKVVTYFVKDAPAEWFRTIEAANPDCIFVYNGEKWGQSQMAWVQPNLEQNAEEFCAKYATKKDGGLYIPCVAAGFNDTNSQTGIGVWGDDPARVWPPKIGANEATLQAFFDVINRHYNTANQLDILQLVTVDDEDEGDGLLSHGFLPVTNGGGSTRIELWKDGAKLGNFPVAATDTVVTVQQADANNNVLTKASMTLKH